MAGEIAQLVKHLLHKYKCPRSNLEAKFNTSGIVELIIPALGRQKWAGPRGSLASLATHSVSFKTARDPVLKEG